ncbi:hypothetical protein CDD81_5872 [Ophiocordyceps australis]|uniref:Major facilitator superfamily (MFS) profile domain-containing protein n=1 Tax=Ophiocordyceps australis TaxID=1399860 RepID=A0A2C5YGY2_9HYPO|nr:hypothetical protein CDD81_5872 [Ophiocordyceps australis]
MGDKDRDLVEEEAGEKEYASGIKLGLIMAALCCAVFVMALDNAIMATAIPRITDEFGSLDDVGWYGSAYMLTGSSLQLVFGKLYSMASIKRVFMGAIGVFEAGSLVCALAPSSGILILGRAMAGVGSAGIFGGALSMLAHTVPLAKRPVYSGLIGSMWGVSSVAGPLLGGVFSDRASWRWCFWINLPVGAVTVGVVGFLFPETRPKTRGVTEGWRRWLWRLDPLGTLAFMAGVAALLLGLHWGAAQHAWTSGRVLGLLLVSPLLLGVFACVEYSMGNEATLPLRIARQRSVWASALYEFFLGACFLVALYFLPLWFQAVRGASAVQSGLLSMPMLLSVVGLSLASGIAVAFDEALTASFLLSAVAAAAASLGAVFIEWKSVKASKRRGHA